MVDTCEDFVAVNTETLVGLLFYKGVFGTTPDLIAAPKDVIEDILHKYVPEDKVKTVSILPLKSQAVQTFLEESQFGKLHVKSCEEYERL